MSRPKRTIKPVQRYEPEEIPNDDDDYDDESLELEEAQKRLKGEFDGLDEDEDEDDDEEEGDEPDEYDENDGFLVSDTAPIEVVEGSGDDSEEYEEDDDENDEDYDDDDEEDVPPPIKIYEPDMVVPEGVVEEGSSDEE